LQEAGIQEPQAFQAIQVFKDIAEILGSAVLEPQDIQGSRGILDYPGIPDLQGFQGIPESGPPVIPAWELPAIRESQGIPESGPPDFPGIPGLLDRSGP
jgi:hypothetical protein